MHYRSLCVLAAVLLLPGCQTFAEVCLDAAGGPGWKEVDAPEWGAGKLAGLGWRETPKTYWYFNGNDAYRACEYRSVKHVPRCGGPQVEEFQYRSGEWTHTIDSVYICH